MGGGAADATPAARTEGASASVSEGNAAPGSLPPALAGLVAGMTRSDGLRLEAAAAGGVLRGLAAATAVMSGGGGGGRILRRPPARLSDTPVTRLGDGGGSGGSVTGIDGGMDFL